MAAKVEMKSSLPHTMQPDWYPEKGVIGEVVSQTDRYYEVKWPGIGIRRVSKYYVREVAA